MLALMAHVRSGRVVERHPATPFLGLLGSGATRGRRLHHRAAGRAGGVSHAVGVVLDERDPLPPLARALLKSTRATDMSKVLDRPELPGATLIGFSDHSRGHSDLMAAALVVYLCAFTQPLLVVRHECPRR